jgi:hypothetical protein
VTKANWYEPTLNRTYQDLAAHYGTAILPARPRKPRDKAKVEAGVLVVERWILARLRNQRFFSLAELNRAIGALLAEGGDRRRHRFGVGPLVRGDDPVVLLLGVELVGELVQRLAELAAHRVPPLDFDLGMRLWSAQHCCRQGGGEFRQFHESSS